MCYLRHSGDKIFFMTWNLCTEVCGNLHVFPMLEASRPGDRHTTCWTSELSLSCGVYLVSAAREIRSSLESKEAQERGSLGGPEMNSTCSWVIGPVLGQAFKLTPEQSITPSHQPFPLFPSPMVASSGTYFSFSFFSFVCVIHMYTRRDQRRSFSILLCRKPWLNKVLNECVLWAWAQPC